MKTNYKELSNDELINAYTKLKFDLFKARFQHKAQQLASPIEIRTLRRDIARTLTEMKVRNIDANSIKMVSAKPKKTQKKVATKKTAPVKTTEPKKVAVNTEAAAAKGE